ncbi:MAG: 50S ribosomal protein L7/L12 [Planctomycetota bacterium]|nr:50S ribosomal protein L7/L12 [Planctomycetota bacterium]
MSEVAVSEAAVTVNFSTLTTELGDRIAELTLKQAKELSDYLEAKYGIKPAAGGAVVMAPAGGGEAAAAPPAKTEFDVVLTGFGDKKLNVVKVVKTLTGASLMDAKKLVEAVPATIKQAVSKEEAEKVKKELEEAGGAVELK